MYIRVPGLAFAHTLTRHRAAAPPPELQVWLLRQVKLTDPTQHTGCTLCPQGILGSSVFLMITKTA